MSFQNVLCWMYMYNEVSEKRYFFIFASWEMKSLSYFHSSGEISVNQSGEMMKQWAVFWLHFMLIEFHFLDDSAFSTITVRPRQTFFTLKISVHDSVQEYIKIFWLLIFFSSCKHLIKMTLLANTDKLCR